MTGEATAAAQATKAALKKEPVPPGKPPTSPDRSRRDPSLVRKSVLVVEDDRSVQGSLAKELRQRGFRAEIAGDIVQAREMIRESKDPYDVAVLDIQLQDAAFPHLTGFDLTDEIRNAQPELPPEIVIYSGNYKLEHYRAAVGLGVAEYIRKDDPEAKNIVSSIGTWALRRSLSPVRAEIGAKVEQIAEESWDTTTAVKHLCSEVIKPEVEACLGVPSIFLLTDATGTQNVILENGLPDGYDLAYTRIQEATFKQNGNGPLAFNLAVLGDLPTPTSPGFRQRLEGSSFIPLHTEGDFRLSMGILQPEETDALNEAKDSGTLAGLLESRFRPPVVKLLKYLARIEAAVQRAERRAVLDHTSRFCVYVGQTQLDALAEAVEKGEIEPSNKCFLRLHRLAQDLNATGNEFSHLVGDSHEATAVGSETKVSASSVVDSARRMLEEQHLAKHLEIKEEGEDFKLPIAEQDLLVAVLRLMQWMAQREDRMPAEVTNPTIEVKYANLGDRLEIRLTDQSLRLGSQLRQRLFDPFRHGSTIVAATNGAGDEHNGLYLPLYLAKTVIELKNNGALKDLTGELDSKRGHCFAISFPASLKGLDTEIV